MIKTIIFDLDGVILESVDVKTNAFLKLFQKTYIIFEKKPDVVNAVAKHRHPLHTEAKRESLKLAR